MTNLYPNPLVREMLLRILNNLWNLTGSKQYIEITTMFDKNEAQGKLDGLIQPMINVCNTFSYISLAEQETIIEQKIIEDPEFYGLNARKIWQYLNGVSGKYFKQEAHKTVEESRASNATPLTPEEFQEKVDALLRTLSGDKAGLKSVPGVTQKEIDDLKMEDLESQEGKKAASVNYKSDPEQLTLIEKRIQYGRLHTDLLTGKVNEGAPTFEAFCKQ